MSRQYLTEDEKAHMPKISKDLLVRIFGYLRPYWLQFVLVFVAILISSVVGLLPAIITGRIVDQALVGTDLGLLIRLLAAALGAMLASQVIGILENYINSWISQRIIFDMKNQMYHHLQHMPHAFFTTQKQGDIVTRMNTDISGVSSVISGTLTQAVSNVAAVATTLVAIFSLNWELAIVGLLVLPLLIAPTRSAGRVRLKLAQESSAKNDEINQIVGETLSASGSLLTKMFARERDEYDRFVAINEEVTQLSMREERSGSWFRVAMGMFTQLGPLLIYFAGGYFIIRGIDPSLTVGTITATVSLVNRLYRPVESLLNLQVSMVRSLALFERIFEYLDMPQTITSPKNAKCPEVAEQPIVFDHVDFGYEPNTLVLHDVTFEVPGGQMFAIVGPSGSGKSSIVNLIPRLYDATSGSVSIARFNVREFDLAYLRSCIGHVTQETYLFNGTIEENLRYAKKNATQQEIEDACRVAHIHDFISSQPDGYHTQVGNRGLKLSGGEKQRISLARVVLKDPKILILDEATSALDSISEQAIQDALEQLMDGRTSIVIAHRLSTILKADRILVVDHGSIVEQGTHAELLSAGGTYKELYETQFRQAIDAERQSVVSGHGLNVASLSTVYLARVLRQGDLGSVLSLARANRVYYRYLHERPTMASLTAELTALPEGADLASKQLVGFYDADGYLVAVLDLTCDYPAQGEVYIGWFMVAADMQRQGVGSSLFADIRASLAAEDMHRVTLRIPAQYEELKAFWEAQGFVAKGLETSGARALLTLEREI